MARIQPGDQELSGHCYAGAARLGTCRDQLMRKSSKEFFTTQQKVAVWEIGFEQ
jgi:hypothetical protein